jgi:hypothetical protein
MQQYVPRRTKQLLNFDQSALSVRMKANLKEACSAPSISFGEAGSPVC